MDSQLGHLCFNELENISYELKEFMSDFWWGLKLKIMVKLTDSIS
jgi:hypothetical protein